MKIKDIMSSPVATIEDTATCREAVQRLSKLGISTLAVVDAQGTYVGLLGDKHLIKKALPQYFDLLGDVRYLKDFEPFEDKLHELSKIPVRDVLKTDVPTVNPDMPLVEVAHLFIHKGFRIIPVLEGDRLVGIVSRADLIRVIAEDTHRTERQEG